ncbi:GNAT family N-acetyltransferase [Aquibacillus kalidii]|uniref:GNAT family N-acetyltransferase n=1 Tax=Aquibacillus kalidii TaxID=2762597 RepID=UPI001647EA5C|nr:GNAT family N-acetyltransferase [Aquibacillus kalidii]
MIVDAKEYNGEQICYTVRSASEGDARQLSQIRLQIDGETENLDRVRGEEYLDEAAFKQLITDDNVAERNVFLIAEINGEIVGFSRCEGSLLKRYSHRVEFGIAVLKEYWGYGIGTTLLKRSIDWADSNGIKKIMLSVLETNEKAIKIYQQHGFEIEGTLRNDKLLSDGEFYNTLVMGRIQ